MASKPSPKHNTITTITDTRGKTIVRIKQGEYMVVDNKGNVTNHATFRNIQLVDGSTWNPTMLQAKPASPAFHVGVCQVCRDRRRQRPTHGLVAMARAKLCECGILCCPQHRRLCSDDKWRCPRCSLKHKVKQFFKPMFFEQIEDSNERS